MNYVVLRIQVAEYGTGSTPEDLRLTVGESIELKDAEDEGVIATIEVVSVHVSNKEHDQAYLN